MGEKQKFDANTKRIVASNLTAAYFATVEKQTRNSSPIGAEREKIHNSIKRIYREMLNLVEDLHDHPGV